ncbi:hypothetical protein VNO80_09183 [Phaseolus coccineus]|uniref:Uncharacterized protein n=1 Tax=Phaseolus coccineus TaxID=3886 RepID=A0AAN9RDG2_PHACN
MVTCTRGWAEVKGTAKGRAREGEGEIHGDHGRKGSRRTRRSSSRRVGDVLFILKAQSFSFWPFRSLSLYLSLMRWDGL